MKLTRAQRADENRRALLDAGAQVVGQVGYASASIGRITDRAGLAQGTFYLYFESRQHFFDQLLPMIGEQLLEHVRSAVHGAKSFFEVEEMGLVAFFDFLISNYGFFRILYETDSISPVAGEKHIDNVVRHYVKFVDRARAEHQIRPLKPIERQVLIYMMMGARDYLAKYLRRRKSTSPAVVREIASAYVAILRQGLCVESVATSSREFAAETASAPRSRVA